MLASSIDRNTRKPCLDPACHRLRHRLSGYCQFHTTRKHLYGHPKGRHIHPAEYRKELEEVRSFVALQVQRQHPAMVAALRLLEDWLDRAWQGEGLDGYRDLQRLKEHEVTPLDILEASAAVWLYSHRSGPAALPDDERLTYALSLAVLALAPRERSASNAPKGYWKKRYPASARRAIGRWLRTNLAPLYTNLCAALSHQQQAAERQQQDLRLPFTDTKETT